jgi:hypothetical protein
VSVPHDATGGFFAMLRLDQTQFYIGEPSITIPTKAIAGASMTASRFSVRAWQDGDRVSAVLYAVVADPRMPNGELETPIATRTLRAGERVQVPEMEKWGAAPVTLTVGQRFPNR